MVLNIVFFLVAIMILAVMYIFLRSRIDKLTDTDKLTKALAGDLDIILAEINQATERNVLIIEDKINELEMIIKTAEKRITLLKKSVEAPPSKPVDIEKKTVIKSAPLVDERTSNRKSGELTYSHLTRLNSMSGMIAPLSVAAKKKPESESLKEQILTLYKSGIDSAIIASNVGVNRGEVELIISLYIQTNGGLE